MTEPDVFKVLADDTRRAILDSLLVEDEESFARDVRDGLAPTAAAGPASR